MRWRTGLPDVDFWFNPSPLVVHYAVDKVVLAILLEEHADPESLVVHLDLLYAPFLDF